MKKIYLIVGLVAGGLGLLLLSVFLFLAAKGKLNSETLTRMPILGRFFGEPVPIVITVPVKEDAKDEKKKEPEEELPPLAHFSLPSPFTAENLNELSVEIDEGRKREVKLTELREKEEDLVKREKDLERRWEDLTTLAAKIEETRKKLDEESKALLQGQADLASRQQESVVTIAAWYNTIEPASKVAELMQAQGAETANLILEEISKENTEKAGAILAALKPEFATELMSLSLKRKRAP